MPGFLQSQRCEPKLITLRRHGMLQARRLARATAVTIQRLYVEHRLTLWLLVCVCALSAGCTPPVPYQPNERLVDTLGPAEARRRLREVVERSINPQVTDSEVTDEFLRYNFRQIIAGFPTGAILENRIHFLNVGRTEVFSNNLVIVRTSSDIVLAQLVFGNYSDAQMFADLLASFKARRAQRR
jgi:hypothetical protein